VISVLRGWELEEHHRRLLELAAQAWDRAAEARERLAVEGLTVKTTERGGMKTHPLVRVEADSSALFARLVRELDLDLARPAESRPPALRSIRGGINAA
jgi:phage terminase small subunit